jgi:hypothetical protein
LIDWKALRIAIGAAVLIVAGVVGLIFLIAWLTLVWGAVPLFVAAGLVIVAIISGIIYNEIVW